MAKFIKSSVLKNGNIVNLDNVDAIYLSEEHLVELATIETNRKVDLYNINFVYANNQTITWKFNLERERDLELIRVLESTSYFDFADQIPRVPAPQLLTENTVEKVVKKTRKKK